VVRPNFVFCSSCNGRNIFFEIFRKKADALQIQATSMVNLSSSVVDRVFEPRSGQTKNCKICICCFSSATKNKIWSYHDLSIHSRYCSRLIYMPAIVAIQTDTTVNNIARSWGADVTREIASKMYLVCSPYFVLCFLLS
jgi:hypothetical protein